MYTSEIVFETWTLSNKKHETCHFPLWFIYRNKICCVSDCEVCLQYKPFVLVKNGQLTITLMNALNRECFGNRFNMISTISSRIRTRDFGNNEVDNIQTLLLILGFAWGPRHWSQMTDTLSPVDAFSSVWRVKGEVLSIEMLRPWGCGVGKSNHHFHVIFPRRPTTDVIIKIVSHQT